MTMIKNRWTDTQAEACLAAAGPDEADCDLALRVYTSRLIGQDPDLVMHGGGNTSVKTRRPDLFGEIGDVLHIKGSGWDLDSLEAPGLPGVWLAPLHRLRDLDSLSDEDMVNAQRRNLLDSGAPNPSVETLLHAFLPHKFVDHTHATPFLVLANQPDADTVCEEIFGDRLAIVDYIMPGFQLAKAAAEVYETNPHVEGLLLRNHGHFAFGDSAKESYERIIDHTNLVARHFGMDSATPLAIRRIPSDPDRLAMLRGILGDVHSTVDDPMPILDLRNGPDVMSFLQRPDIADLATRGVASPDHVIRTKSEVLWLSQQVWNGGRAEIHKAVAGYIERYRAYFDRHAPLAAAAKTMVTPTPNLAWVENIGLIGIGGDAATAAIAADLGEQNIRVRGVGEDHGGFMPIGEPDNFAMEYWSLEQAKLGKKTAPAFAGRVVMVTGAAGEIGAAVSRGFAAGGACVVMIDVEQKRLNMLADELGPGHLTLCLDVMEADTASEAMRAAVCRFGGLDYLVSNAGFAVMGEMHQVSNEALRRSFEMNFFAHQNFSAAAAKLMLQQDRGGQILFNVSKIAVNPGQNFGPYGLPKATTMYLLRQMALELGPSGIRVNGVNADRVRSGIVDEDFIRSRASSRGVTTDEYMSGNLMRREVEARHVAEAFITLARSERTSAHVMPVDGGNIEAALR